MHGNVMTSLNTATGKFGPESRTVGTLSPAGMGKPVQDPDSETGWSYQNRDGTLTKNAPIPPGQRGNVGQSQASDDKLRARIMNPKTADAELAGMANDAGMMQSVETPVGSGHYVPAQFGPDAKLTNAQRFDLYKTVSTQRSGGLAGAAGVKAPSPVQATSDHGKIVRTGTDKATGKKVVQYEDGTIGPAT
jgi:hypothetical protein